MIKVKNTFLPLKVKVPVIDHHATGVGNSARANIGQPVQSPHNSSVFQVEIGCKKNKRVMLNGNCSSYKVNL